ncbi:MAG: DUF3368 domain-containing protein [Sandaracinaceae bacterium]|nr:DUF3368 domain-containing protein [Sandaracinaceae bacterium]
MAAGRVAVIDSSVVIALVAVDQLHLLDAFFSEVRVPLEVYQHELAAKRAAKEPDELRRLSRITMELHVHPVPDAASMLGRGEQQAIAAALAHDAMLLVDERRARRVAQELHIEVRGTLGILLEGKRRGLIPLVGPFVAELLRGGFRLSDDLVRSVLQAAGESVP